MERARHHDAVLAVRRIRDIRAFADYRPSLHELLPASALTTLPRVAAYLISITLFGWAVGGVIGGVIGDRLGRRWTMIGSVVLYSIFTGTSALSPNGWQVPWR